MNRKRFKKELERIIDYWGFIPIIEIEAVISNDKKDFFNNVSMPQLLIENLDYIIEKSGNYGGEFDMILELLKIPELRPVILERLDTYCLKYDYNKFIYWNSKRAELVAEVVANNFEEMVEKKGLIYLVKQYYEYEEFKNNELLTTKMNEQLEKNPQIIIDYIGKKYFEENHYMRLREVLTKLLVEIVNEEKVKYTDIVRPGQGTYSSVVFIGNKVFKLGTRRCDTIPNNRRIIKPLIRKDLSDLADISLVVEVTNKANTSFEITDEELYQIYKELRDKGIVFTDIKKDNIGVLLTDNEFNWNSPLGDEPEAKGLIGDNEEPLKKGDYVIIDSDYLFFEDDPNIEIGDRAHYSRFEKRYEEEKYNMTSKELEECEEEYQKLVEGALNLDKDQTVSNKSSGKK